MMESNLYKEGVSRMKEEERMLKTKRGKLKRKLKERSGGSEWRE